jgi:protease I
MARIAFIIDNDFEDSEFRVPYDRIKAAGHRVEVIGPRAEPLMGKKKKETVTPDVTIDDADAADYDALVIPGGYSPDKLRTNPKMVAFTRETFLAGKPVAAVCHAGSLLVEADIAEGKMVTSWPSVRTDLINAGARWVDREVVEDENLITSRKPDDLPAFTQAILRQVEVGVRKPEAAEPPPSIH